MLNFENLDKFIFDGVGKYNIPQIEPVFDEPLGDFIPMNYVKTAKTQDDKILHCFVDDYQFARYWNTPDKYIPMLSKFKAVCSPDFSTYTDMPLAMQMEKLYDLKEKLCKELDKIAAKRDMSAGDLEMAHKLTDTIKNIDKIAMLEEGNYSEDGYSNNGKWTANMEGSYGRGSSYARHRDRMGRYSRNGDYSRNGGYSSRNSESGDHIMGMLEDMIHDAKNDREKDAIRRCMSELRG